MIGNNIFPEFKNSVIIPSSELMNIKTEVFLFFSFIIFIFKI